MLTDSGRCCGGRQRVRGDPFTLYPTVVRPTEPIERPHTPSRQTQVAQQSRPPGSLVGLVGRAQPAGLSAFSGFPGSSHHGVLCEGIPNGPLGGRESLFRNRYPCRREGSEKRTSWEVSSWIRAIARQNRRAREILRFLLRLLPRKTVRHFAIPKKKLPAITKRLETSDFAFPSK